MKGKYGGRDRHGDHSFVCFYISIRVRRLTLVGAKRAARQVSLSQAFNYN